MLSNASELLVNLTSDYYEKLDEVMPRGMGPRSSLEIIVNIFMLPFISVIGLLLNVLCSLVFWKIIKTNHKRLYKYLFLSSIVNSLAMLVDALAVMPLCGDSCLISRTYFSQAFYVYGFIYLADVLETYTCLIDIVIALDHYSELSNRMRFIKKRSYKLIGAFLMLLCIVFYVPFILKKKIVFDESNKKYTLATSDFGKNKFWISFIIVQLVISELLLLVVMITCNLLLVFSLRNSLYFEQRESTSSASSRMTLESNRCFLNKSSDHSNSTSVDPSSETSKFSIGSAANQLVVIKRRKMSEYKHRNEFKCTLMIICMSLIIFLSNTPTVAVHTIELLFFKLDPVLVNKLNAVSNLLIVASYTFYIFVFCYFNSVFRKALYGMLKCCANYK